MMGDGEIVTPRLIGVEMATVRGAAKRLQNRKLASGGGPNAGVCFGLMAVVFLIETPSVTAATAIDEFRPALEWYLRWHLDLGDSATTTITCTVRSAGRTAEAECSLPKALRVIVNLEDPPFFSLVSQGERTSASMPRRSTKRSAHQVVVYSAKQACRADWEKTAAAYRIARSNYVRSGRPDSSLRVHFPIVCRGDPLYHVYFTRNGNVSWIWQFSALELRESDYPNWTYDLLHKNLPRGSNSRVGRQSLWYKVE